MAKIFLHKGVKITYVRNCYTGRYEMVNDKKTSWKEILWRVFKAAASLGLSEFLKWWNS
jgi:hypothetical protein